MSSEPSRVALRSAGKAVLAPYWLYEGARVALGASGIPFGIEANRQQAYKLGLASDFGPAAPYLEAGIPAVELKGDGAVEPPAAGWFTNFVGRFARDEAKGFSDAWDRHYFIIQIGRLFAGVQGKGLCRHTRRPSRPGA